MEEGQRSSGAPGSTPATTTATAETRAHAHAIELFHLAFMQVAAAQLKPEDYAVKGGGNLRFFLRSGRRSADLDLDYLGGNFDAFGDRVNALLAGPAVSRLLRLQNISLGDLRRPKNTDTTKRWKFTLSRPGMQDASSKVEFSGRDSLEEPVLGQSDSTLARRLGGVAVRLQHYAPPEAVTQKVRALCTRSTTEPRDVFDLDHLIRQFAGALESAQLEPDAVLKAARIAEDIAYDRYAELVEPYLDEEVVELYSGDQAWLDMQLRVIDALRRRAGLIS